MSVVIFILLTVVLSASLLISAQSYTGYKVLRVIPTYQQFPLLIPYYTRVGFDFWTEPRLPNAPLHIMVAPQYQEPFTKFLRLNNVSSSVFIDDVQRIINSERETVLRIPKQRRRGITFDRYYRHSEINYYLDELALKYPNLTTVVSIGKSTEGRDLKMVRISSSNNSSNPIILIDSGIHAREWIAPAMALYIIQQLVEDDDKRSLSEDVEWHILPVFNPDGYEYSHSRNRLWRKTRSKTKVIFCRGVDANRNFDFHWKEIGASSIPCSETFAGTHPFSEPETDAFRNYVMEHKERIKLYLTFHSYGNYILYPWGYTSDLPEDADTLDSIAREANKAQAAVSGIQYTVGTSTNVLYAAAGGSDDWVKGVAGVNLSYTIELPGGGRSGFDMPPSSIFKTVSQFFPAIQVFGQYV